MMELEKDYKRKTGSGSGSDTGYTVEAMYNYHSPIAIAGQLFDNRWRKVNFEKHPMGVPACARYQRNIVEHGLFGYAAAQALRWWLHANAEAEHGFAGCLETRLVAHKISYTHEVEAVSVHEHLHGDDRSNCIPDWGKQK